MLQVEVRSLHCFINTEGQNLTCEVIVHIHGRLEQTDFNAQIHLPGNFEYKRILNYKINLQGESNPGPSARKFPPSHWATRTLPHFLLLKSNRKIIQKSLFWTFYSKQRRRKLFTTITKEIFWDFFKVWSLPSFLKVVRIFGSHSFLTPLVLKKKKFSSFL